MCCLDGKHIGGMFQVCRHEKIKQMKTETLTTRVTVYIYIEREFPCTLFGLQGYCAKVVAFKTLSNYQCDRNVINSMTDECSQRQYGRSVYRHCKDEFIHSQSGNASFILQVCNVRLISK